VWDSLDSLRFQVRCFC